MPNLVQIVMLLEKAFNKTIPLFIFSQACQDTFNSSYVTKMDFINEWPLSPPHNLKLETIPRPKNRL